VLTLTTAGFCFFAISTKILLASGWVLLLNAKRISGEITSESKNTKTSEVKRARWTKDLSMFFNPYLTNNQK
jgi:hypothetical protein